MKIKELPDIINKYFKKQIDELHNSYRVKLIKLKEDFENSIGKITNGRVIGFLLDGKLITNKDELYSKLEKAYEGKIDDRTRLGVELPITFFINGLKTYDDAQELIDNHNNELNIITKDYELYLNKYKKMLSLMIKSRKDFSIINLDNDLKTMITEGGKEELENRISNLRSKLSTERVVVLNSKGLYGILEKILGDADPTSINLEESLNKWLQSFIEKKKNNVKKIRSYEKKIKNLIDNKEQLIDDYHNHLKIKKEASEKIIRIEKEIKKGEEELNNLESALSKLERINTKNGSLINSIMKKRGEVLKIIKDFEEKFGVEIEDF